MDDEKIRVGVLLGGISAEKDVSLESGRNVVNKLLTSQKYTPIPIFLTGSLDDLKLYILPVNLLFQDNTEEICRRIRCRNAGMISQEEQMVRIRDEYSKHSFVNNVIPVAFENLPYVIDFAFIALHGIPGEDGTIQSILDKLSIQYNGSSAEVAKLTMNKYLTNRKLHEHGINVADQHVIEISDWNNNKYPIMQHVSNTFKYPIIVKPVDDGSSAGVVLINSELQLEKYIDVAFMNTPLTNILRDEFGIKKNGYIPFHKSILVEEFISKGDSGRLAEITCGLMVHHDYDGNKTYEIFNPSEVITHGNVLSHEEKFLSGEGQNITPSRFSNDQQYNELINNHIRSVMLDVAKILNLDGYARIDAMLKVYSSKVEVWVIEVNSLPALTPSTCIFHQAAINGYTPLKFIERVIDDVIRR